MVLIPAGKFKMGPPNNSHDVTLTKPFYIGKHEVTQDQYEAVMGINPSKNKDANLPVTDVSWNDCQEFIKKLNAKTNGGYRFPTEAEWEYACRAGTTTAYSFGDSITSKDANYDTSGIGISKPVAVGSYKINAFGLYDMHGNVSEWCEDGKEDYPLGSATDPKGRGDGTNRVLRGGSLSGDVLYSRSSNRYDGKSSDGYFWGGFRLAKTP